MKVNAYGRELIILRENSSWQIFEAGNEGKRRLVRDIHIPDTTRSEEIVQYLSDLLHEYASDRHPAKETLNSVAMGE